MYGERERESIYICMYTYIYILEPGALTIEETTDAAASAAAVEKNKR